MAQAIQKIEGTAEELIAYLEKRRNRTNLTLLVPSESTEATNRALYPEGAVVRNGVPLFPTEGRTEIVTPERVKLLIEEE